MTTIFTIGHSTHSAEAFQTLLISQEIAMVADVRSVPYSRMNPQFNRETLRENLNRSHMSYVLLGRELGARSSDRESYRAGKVRYDLLAKTGAFQRGLESVLRSAQTHRVALLCAERDPLTCHRCILVGRHLTALGSNVHHILGDGGLESHTDALKRLVGDLKLEQGELFDRPRDLIEKAYRLREEQIAYVDENAGKRPSDADSPTPTLEERYRDAEARIHGT